MSFQLLPLDLIAEILGLLDLESLIKMSQVSRTFRMVASDEGLNPWRGPIMRNLLAQEYEISLKHLSIRTAVPRQNWLDILSFARASFILFEATIPNLRASDWEECFKRRFTPSWERVRKDRPWKEAFLKVLHRVWHRSSSSCTSDEAWTRYIVLNRAGSANQLFAASRGFDPFLVFDEIKLENNLQHLETVYVPVVDLQDLRILALGTLERPRTNFPVNANAHIFLNPPGIYTLNPVESNIISNSRSLQKPSSSLGDFGVYPMSATAIPSYLFEEYDRPSITYKQLRYPQPSPTQANYPFFTPGGGDMRWSELERMLREGLHWVGRLMIVTQIRGPTSGTDNLFLGRHQYASFAWDDLWAIAPWMEERISEKINGPGLHED